MCSNWPATVKVRRPARSHVLQIMCDAAHCSSSLGPSTQLRQCIMHTRCWHACAEVASAYFSFNVVLGELPLGSMPTEWQHLLRRRLGSIFIVACHVHRVLILAAPAPKTGISKSLWHAKRPTPSLHVPVTSYITQQGKHTHVCKQVTDVGADFVKPLAGWACVTDKHTLHTPQLSWWQHSSGRTLVALHALEKHRPAQGLPVARLSFGKEVKASRKQNHFLPHSTVWCTDPKFQPGSSSTNDYL